MAAFVQYIYTIRRFGSNQAVWIKSVFKTKQISCSNTQCILLVLNNRGSEDGTHHFCAPDNTPLQQPVDSPSQKKNVRAIAEFVYSASTVVWRATNPGRTTHRRAEHVRASAEAGVLHLIIAGQLAKCHAWTRR
jgi:hypothetical protein